MTWTPLALGQNRKAFQKLHELARSRAYRVEPDERSGTEVRTGWYLDPSGRHELRYWDGEVWTTRSRSGTTRPR